MLAKIQTFRNLPKMFEFQKQMSLNNSNFPKSLLGKSKMEFERYIPKT